MLSSVSVETQSIGYEVVHTTQYDYSQSVAVSHHLARLTPRSLPRQTCLHHELKIEPSPGVMKTHADYFGNTMTFFIMQAAHKRLEVQARSRVAVAPARLPAPAETPPWEQATNRAALPLEAIECTFDSSSIRVSAELAAYARPSFAPGMPLLEAVARLTARIHGDFTFDSKATTITTPLAEVFASRRGVCQDFARLEIACLRCMGLAAHYVSGYLETVPPPGRSRLLGADASHAWLAVYCPDMGWIDVDPTNNLFPSGTHVTLAWGRDYADVSPIRGVIVGGGTHSLNVSVDVIRLDDA
jgi:transglutaminase-like putative cysteine protease